MPKILVIAHREYAAMVATKAFIFSLVMMPIMMFGGLFLMPRLSKMGGGQTQRIIVADGTGKVLEKLKAASELRNAMIRKTSERSSVADHQGDSMQENTTVDAESADRLNATADDRMSIVNFFEIEAAESSELTDQQRLELSEQIRNGKLYAFAEIPADLFEEGDQPVKSLPFVGQDSALSEARQWLQTIIQEYVNNERMKEFGIDPILVSKATMRVALEPTLPFTANKDGTMQAPKSGQALIAIFLPFAAMMLMFIVIFLAAQPMLESGMEEKSYRVSEVLLGSISPTELMAGKLLGNVAGSLMIFAIYGIGGIAILQKNGWMEYLPMNLVPWFLLFQILGVLFYSSIFLTVGASVSDLKEAQSMLLPVWMFLVVPMMVWFVAIREPNGIVATWISFFPPCTPLMMILRMASGQSIPIWQVLVSASLLVATTTAVVYLSGRIYRAGLLRTDSVKTLRQIIGRLQS